MSTNSRYLKWFHDIERDLWQFFHLFDPLCERCAMWTLRESHCGSRSNRDQWNCCMIDNQVHDNWETLDPVQCRRDPRWYAKLKRLPMGRMPGNGPCPALGSHGCRLPRHRPITCTTQLCAKMLRVLKRLGMYNGNVSSALQIEDIIPLPDILPSLYGSARSSAKKPVVIEDVKRYQDLVRQWIKLLSRCGVHAWEAAVDAELPMLTEEDEHAS